MYVGKCVLPVSFDFIVTAVQFSLGDVILHVTSRLKRE